MVHALEFAIAVKEVVREKNLGLHDVDRAARILRKGGRKMLQGAVQIGPLLSLHLWITRKFRANEVDDVKQDTQAVAVCRVTLQKDLIQEAVNVEEEPELGRVLGELPHAVVNESQHRCQLRILSREN